MSHRKNAGRSTRSRIGKKRTRKAPSTRASRSRSKRRRTTSATIAGRKRAARRRAALKGWATRRAAARRFKRNNALWRKNATASRRKIARPSRPRSTTFEPSARAELVNAENAGARGRRSDPLQVQVAIHHTPNGGVPNDVELSRELVEQMVRSKAETGRDPSGLRLEIVRWKNPSRPGDRAGWRSGHQGDAWATLRRPLQRATVDRFTVRRGETLV